MRYETFLTVTNDGADAYLMTSTRSLKDSSGFMIIDDSCKTTSIFTRTCRQNKCACKKPTSRANFHCIQIFALLGRLSRRQTNANSRVSKRGITR